MKSLLWLSLVFLTTRWVQAQDKPLRIGIAGMTHDHVNYVFDRMKQKDVEIVGFAEPNKELAMRLLKRHNLPESLWFATLEELIAKTKPEAVCAYNSIFEHLKVVEVCAPKGIHVMVEKPLAVNMEHARKMEALAQKHKIQLLTNYETTWYSSHQEAYKMIYDQKTIGDIRKVVVHDGHEGPKEIGCSKEFLNWLTDPVMNGGGAIIDFGCYGANLMTWLQKGERPISVTAVAQTIKPDKYPKVDDDATIILKYPHAQAVIQASWNWPFGRKDIEIYGQTGYIFGDRSLEMRVRKGDESSKEQIMPITPLAVPINDSFTYLKAAVRGQVDTSNDLSSLKVNTIVVEILDAAVQSSKTGKTIVLK